jgi:hypothetical protein
MKHVQKKRRSFLQSVAVLGGGAVVSAMAGGAAAGDRPVEPSPAARSRGYRATRHVRDYYAKARF